MNETTKKAILVFGGGTLLFYLLNFVFKIQDEKEKAKKEEKDEKDSSLDSSKDNPSDKKEKQKDALVLKKAFTDAIIDKQPASFLNEMNAEFAKTYKMKVHKSKSTGKLFVADLSGKVIL
jgi:hypothetical protein